MGKYRTHHYKYYTWGCSEENHRRIWEKGKIMELNGDFFSKNTFGGIMKYDIMMHYDMIWYNAILALDGSSNSCNLMSPGKHPMN